MDPYGLVSKAGVWYLVADRDGEPPLFRTDRVEAAAVTDEPVRRAVPARTSPRSGHCCANASRACRTASASTAVYAAGNWRSSSAFSSPSWSPRRSVDDAWALAELAFRELPDVRGLLSMGATVEVLDPPEARAELTAVATELAALYGARA